MNYDMSEWAEGKNIARRGGYSYIYQHDMDYIPIA